MLSLRPSSRQTLHPIRRLPTTLPRRPPTPRLQACRTQARKRKEKEKGKKSQKVMYILLSLFICLRHPSFKNGRTQAVQTFPRRCALLNCTCSQPGCRPGIFVRPKLGCDISIFYLFLEMCGVDRPYENNHQTGTLMHA